MSTKCTLDSGPKHHLYVELFESDMVYLEIEETEFLAWKNGVRVAIPLEVWDHIRAKSVVAKEFWGDENSPDAPPFDFPQSGMIAPSVMPCVVQKKAPASSPTTLPLMPVRFSNRLVWDISVSDSSPVVKGTLFTVNWVISKIKDGYGWSEIMRLNPQLTEDDIRVCMGYTVAEGNGTESGL